MKLLQDASEYVSNADLHRGRRQRPLRTAMGFHSVLENGTRHRQLVARTVGTDRSRWSSHSSTSIFAAQLQPVLDKHSATNLSCNDTMVDQRQAAADGSANLSSRISEELRSSKCGSTSREKVESYVAAQATHHLSDNSSLCALFSDLAMLNSDIDLSKARFTAHARYWANLHLVFVHNWRQAITDPDIWIGIRKMLRRASQSKGHLLSRAGFVPDHLHFTIGIHPSESPLEVALSYMNNLAWVHNQKAIFMPSFYVATFGEYDLGAIHPATGPAPVADDGMGLL